MYDCDRLAGQSTNCIWRDKWIACTPFTVRFAATINFFFVTATTISYLRWKNNNRRLSMPPFCQREWHWHWYWNCYMAFAISTLLYVFFYDFSVVVHISMSIDTSRATSGKLAGRQPVESIKCFFIVDNDFVVTSNEINQSAHGDENQHTFATIGSNISMQEISSAIVMELKMYGRRIDCAQH